MKVRRRQPSDDPFELPKIPQSAPPKLKWHRVSTKPIVPPKYVTHSDAPEPPPPPPPTKKEYAQTLNRLRAEYLKETKNELQKLAKDRLQRAYSQSDKAPEGLPGGFYKAFESQM